MSSAVVWTAYRFWTFSNRISHEAVITDNTSSHHRRLTFAYGMRSASCFVRQAPCPQPSSVGLIHFVHQGFLPLDQVLVQGLVARLDLIHLPTVARIALDHSVLRFHLLVKKEYHICVNSKLCSSSMNLDFLTCMSVNGVAPKHYE